MFTVTVNAPKRIKRNNLSKLIIFSFKIVAILFVYVKASWNATEESTVTFTALENGKISSHNCKGICSGPAPPPPTPSRSRFLLAKHCQAFSRRPLAQYNNGSCRQSLAARAWSRWPGQLLGRLGHSIRQVALCEEDIRWWRYKFHWWFDSSLSKNHRNRAATWRGSKSWRNKYGVGKFRSAGLRESTFSSINRPQGIGLSSKLYQHQRARVPPPVRFIWHRVWSLGARVRASKYWISTPTLQKKWSSIRSGQRTDDPRTVYKNRRWTHHSSRTSWMEQLCQVSEVARIPSQTWDRNVCRTLSTRC